jgi:hypothetical protein
MITVSVTLAFPQKFNVNTDWIKTGKGDMFSDPPPDVKLIELIDTFKKLNGYFQDYTLDHIKKLVRIQETEYPKKKME